MENKKIRTFSCGVTILCLISATIAFPRYKRQLYPGNPWFGGEFEGGPMMAGGPYSYQSPMFPGNGMPNMRPIPQINSAGRQPGMPSFPPTNSAGQGMTGPQTMLGQGFEIEPTQPADIEPAEGIMMGRPPMGRLNVQPANPALQTSPARQQVPNNINRGLNAMPFGMAGPMGEMEPAQAPDIEPPEVMMPMNTMGARGSFPTNSMWNSFQQYPSPSQATPPSLYNYRLPVVPSQGTAPVAGNGNNQARPRANLSNIPRPQMNPMYSPNPNPAEIPVLRNPLRVEPSLFLTNVPVSVDAPSFVPQNPPQGNQVPRIVQGSSVMAVQPQAMPIIPAVNAQSVMSIVPAVNAQAVPYAGLVATPSPGPAPAFQLTGPPQAAPPDSVLNNRPFNSGLTQTGPVIVPPRGPAQAPPPAPLVGEFEPAQAPDIEPAEETATANRARVQVQGLPFQPAAGPMKVVNQAGAPPQTPPVSGPQWKGYVF